MASHRRCCLELLKWVSPQDILLIISQLSAFWLALTETRELWRVLGEEAGIIPDPQMSPKEAFRYCRKRLALITSSSLHSFALNTLLWHSQPLSIRVQVDSSSAWAITPECAFICSGGGRASLEVISYAYKIRQSGAVRTLNSLRCPRMSHGTIAVCGYCYVFGGQIDAWEATTSVEKIKLERVVNEEWSRVGYMRSARYNFTPCEYQDKVYLAGGMTELVEVFHPVSERFEGLSLLVEDTAAVASISQGRLVVLTRKNMYVETSGVTEKKSRPKIEDISGNMSAVLHQRCIWVVQAEKLFGVDQINLETLETSHWAYGID